MDRDKLRAAAEKATKGPWEYLSVKEAFARPTINAIDGCYICYMLDNEFSNTDANANFIALTDPDTIIEMCDALDSAEKENVGLKEWINELAEAHDLSADELAFTQGGVEKYITKSENLKAENTRLRKCVTEAINRLCPCDSQINGCDDAGCGTKQWLDQALTQKGDKP